jgi:outer membrane protein TolC
MFRPLLLALPLGLAAWGTPLPCAAAAPAPVPRVPKELLQARVDAARQTYQIIEKQYQVGQGTLAELPRWSRRWLKAQRALSATRADDVAALQAHLERMRKLEKIVQTQVKAGGAGVQAGSAATYYRVEAEIWLAEIKGK